MWRDWLLVAAVGTSVAVEAVVRDDQPWGLIPIGSVLLLVGTLLWRRTAPLPAAAAMFGALALASLAELVGADPALPYSLAWVLVLPYALLRWGSGRDAAVGLAMMLVTAALDLAVDFGDPVEMPGIDGIEATRLLAGADVADPMAVVVISTFDLDEYVHRALKAGARGFLLKDAGPELLTQAVHAAADGDALIAPNVTVRLLEAFARATTEPPTTQPVEPLTDREEEVLATLARGRSNSEIADELYISLSTVKTHIASLMRKLGARNRVEIALWAYETGRLQRR